MLYLSLVVSTILLLTANWLARRSRHAGATIVCSSLGFLVGPFFLMCVLPAVAIQALLLCLATVIWRASGRGPSFFLALSCGATLIAHVLSGVMVLESEREYARLRALYPYESMEARVPAPRSVLGETSLPPATAQRLSQLEEIPEHANGYRAFQLETLHERAVTLFINSPGFGIARMLHPSGRGLAANLRKGPVPSQPGTRFSSHWSPGELERRPDVDEAPFNRVLEVSILNFINPRGFGYFKDRRHVAGFEPHRFSEVPAAENRWTVQSLELVSLLLHDEPVVYVSTELPRMDRIQGLSTRTLDRFERFGLSVLRQGEDIFTAAVGDGVRMLGAVRSAKQCVTCHGGERGALLGTFSYTLRANGPLE